MAEDWITAAEALHRVTAVSSNYAARRTICSRAHVGLIKAKAARLVLANRTEDDCIVPKEFWWARGEAALEQNWASGDFETWIDRKYRLLAYGVSFALAGIEAIIANSATPRTAANAQPQAKSQANVGGRPQAAWWDDLWIEMCRQLYAGDLKPENQSAVENAMMTWAAQSGHDVALSTVRLRARKLFFAINREDKN